MTIPNLTCNDAFRQKLIDNLAAFEPISHSGVDKREAAVALTITTVKQDPAVYDMHFEAEWATHAAVILTRRASKMRKHAGQWALPGGRVDPGETPVQAALRELQEEVGLVRTEADVIGRLDDFTTRSGFVMKPFVVWGGTDPVLIPNPDEVEQIFRIPVAEFLREDSPFFMDSAESEHPILFMTLGTSWIAAPTAAIVYQFREVAILGKQTRVAHFDQPKFAWK